MRIDVSIVVTFHREGALAVPALASLGDLVDHARAHGLTVETVAVLDRADDATRDVIEAHRPLLDVVLPVDVGDSALARNAGLVASTGGFVAFLDGDDLWGEDWVTAAVHAARDSGRARAGDGGGSDAVWHPQYVHFFTADDRHITSDGAYPRSAADSFVMEQHPSDRPDLDRRALLVNNLWTANVLAARRLFETYPFPANDVANGFGIEDWTWNLATTWAGVPHRIVPGTVHMVRMRGDDSQGRENVRRGLLPRLPDGAAFHASGPR